MVQELLGENGYVKGGEVVITTGRVLVDQIHSGAIDGVSTLAFIMFCNTSDIRYILHMNYTWPTNV